MSELAQRILDMRDGKSAPIFHRVENRHSVCIMYGVWEDDLFELAEAALKQVGVGSEHWTIEEFKIWHGCDKPSWSRSMHNFCCRTYGAAEELLIDLSKAHPDRIYRVSKWRFQANDEK